MEYMEKALVLVVDDEKLFRDILHKMLYRLGFQNICEAENGGEAIGMAGKYSPDLIFMDIEMPEMDGISATKSIKKTFPGAKVIMMTGSGTPSRVTDSLKAGATNIILKPFESTQLKAVVNKALGIN